MVPPGTMKTLLTGVFFPTWLWIAYPSNKFIYVTYSGKRTLKAARQHRDLVQHKWFQERWGHVSIPYQNTHAASFFENTHKGFRFSTSTGGEVTGEHANIICGDDLNKAQDATGKFDFNITGLDKAWEFWSETLPTRQGDPRTTRQMLIGQCLHECDVPQRWMKLSEKLTQKVHVLCLPMRYESGHPLVCTEDPREEGELLWPEHMPEEELADLEKTLGPAATAAQMQQRPSPVGGAVFKRAWFINFWKELPNHLFKVQSWDHSFGSMGENASWVVGQVWGQKGADKYLIDQTRFKGEFPEMISNVETMTAKHHDVITKLFEKKAAGVFIVQQMKRKIVGMVYVEASSATGGKLARAQSITGICQAGNVWLPHPTDARLFGRPHPCPWVHDFIERVCSFKGVKGDIADEVDTMSQALRYLEDINSNRFAEAMERLKNER